MATIYLDALDGLPGKGPIPSEYMIVGQSPSTKRPKDRLLEPFGASSWDLLERIRQNVQGDIYATNLVKVPREPGSKISKADARRWAPILMEEILLVQPRRILAVGKEAALVLCEGFKNLREDHGTFFWNKTFECWVVPTHHFAAAFRNPSLKPMLIRDLQRFFTLPDPDRARYEMIGDPADLVIEPRSRVTLDIETTGVEMGSEITMIGIGLEAHPDVSYILDKPTPNQVVRLTRMLRDRNCTMIGHNLPFDLSIMLDRTKGQIARVDVEDTMQMAHTVGEEVLSLKHLTTRYTDLPGSRAGGGYTDPAYLAEDVRSTTSLHHYLKGRADGRYAIALMNEMVPIAAALRYRGVYVHRPLLEELIVTMTQELEASKVILDQYTGGRDINWNSPAQVAQYLVDAGIKLTARTKTGAWSTAEAALNDLLLTYPDHPALTSMKDYRDRFKMVNTNLRGYLQMLEYDGLLHPKLRLTGTDTGRLSCADPNMQNVHRRGPLKLLFRARWEGGLIGLTDLSQAELRVACLLTGDVGLLTALQASDPHRYVASTVFEKTEEEVSSTERKASKAVTFGLLYLGSPAGLAERSGLPVRLIKQVLKMMEERYPDLVRWLYHHRDIVGRHPWVDTLFGRTRRLEVILKEEGVNGAARKMVNTRIQSVASDIMLVVICGIYRRVVERRMKSRPLFPVHDSVISEIYPGEVELYAQVVREAFNDLLTTPLTTLPLFGELEIIGDLVVGETWAHVESTNENYAPLATYPAASHTFNWSDL